jgi:hypothetical protein
MPFDGTGTVIRTDLLAKINLMMEMLGSKERWCKKQFRGAEGERCLLAAVKDAGGGKDLSAMILRAAVETSGICYDRVDHFNDSSSTNHALVMRVLGRVRDTLEVGPDPTLTLIASSPPVPTVVSPHAERRTGWQKRRSGAYRH